MAITVRYFGAIAEETGLNEERLDLEEVGSDLGDLKSFCEGKYPITDLAYQTSINKRLTSEGHLSDGDEVAFLPPFAGG